MSIEHDSEREITSQLWGDLQRNYPNAMNIFKAWFHFFWHDDEVWFRYDDLLLFELPYGYQLDVFIAFMKDGPDDNWKIDVKKFDLKEAFKAVMMATEFEYQN